MMHSHVLFCAAAVLACSGSASGAFAPVVIVPGTGGSRLEAKLDKPSVPHFYCSRKSDWYTLWLSVTQLLPPAINCWVDNIKLLWDKGTDTYTNNVGVTTRVPGWGSTEGFEYLDPALKAGQSDYFHTLVERMVAAGGVRNVTVRGSPYDFRRAPTSAYDGAWAAKMTQLVEETYAMNNGTQVTLMSHSMGCLYTLWFLNQKAQAWKAKYVRRWVPTAGVFAGAGTGIKQLVSGSNEGIPGVKGLTVRDEQRSYESSMMLVPSEAVWGDAGWFVSTPARNYTARAGDLHDLLDAAGFDDGYLRYQLVANRTRLPELTHPGVDVVHMYGTGVATPTQFVYPAGFDAEPTTINGDGDGTVPLRSLAAAGGKWANASSFRFTAHEFPKASHGGILKDEGYITQLLALLVE